MLKLNQIKINTLEKDQFLSIKKKIAKTIGAAFDDIKDVSILKQSIDARKKPDLFFVYTAVFSVTNEKEILYRTSKNKELSQNLTLYNEKNYCFPYETNSNNLSRPIIVGSGPAGLFCALYLAEAGFRPIVIERGEEVEKRTLTVNEFWKGGKLNLNSNVQFGEGGAGTFSDGKLNTLIKDPLGLNKEVLNTFVKYGAPSKILFDYKPHIGTDILINVVKNIRNQIISLGGEVRFDSLVNDILIENGRAIGVVLQNNERLLSDNIILAIGHSARDTFEMLLKKGIFMEPKSFAVGFRVQHRQADINLSQYGKESDDGLGAAPYKVTAKTSSGRGVFSFCMCPGGYVVNASSEDNMLAINGMSYSKRDGKNANSAIIISVSTSDYPDMGALSGMYFQRDLESRAFLAGEGKIPLQRYGSFKNTLLGDEVANIDSDLSPEVMGQFTWADLTGIMTNQMNEAFIEGMESFGKSIKGFDSDNTILAGIESRTSSPVRINRDVYFMSNISGIYPCGEGAGYAGGITSAAMDGIKVAEAVAKSLLQI